MDRVVGSFNGICGYCMLGAEKRMKIIINYHTQGTIVDINAYYSYILSPSILDC